MKSLIIALSIGLLTIVGSIAYTNHLESVTEQMTRENEIIAQALENERFEEANKSAKELIAFVREKRVILDAVGNHQELDDIEKNLCEMTAFTQEKNKDDSIAKCRVLSFLIESLPRNFKIKIENIL